MRTVALISGGKDSCYNMMQCVIEGHDIIALANLKPREKDELDSYMYQTVGHHAIHLYADAIGLPLYRHTIEGSSTAIKMDYETTVGDEVEDLYTLLKKIKDELQIEAVSVGAILSDYQRVRVEHVCQRLGLTSLAYLWRRDQSELLKEMIDSGVSAILIKVASMGLNPKTHLGRNLKELYPQLIQMNKEFQLNVCGEGGEYETFTVDCPLFNKFIVIDTSEEVIHSNDAFAPVSYLNLQSVHVEDKHFDMKKRLTSRLDHYPMKRSSDIHKEIFSENEPLIHESEICELDTPYKCPESTDLIKLQVKQREKDIWITGVTVKRERGKTTEEMTCLAMNKLKECMLERTGNWSLSDLCMINLYISDMNDFGAINDIYKKYFGLNPPARVCVQVPLPENIVLQLECYGSCNEDKHTMHVQSISHWAPANIGPYSQAVKMSE
ncbi:diphthine--ammonia ligase-like isoform X3 [Mytilus galloprovincialis]|uniref:diphthine--ammonia ligase-like isoform X3 n=1 Tax=Mytilus galloprovincialis TaxID=29158 RepID=UPI003F7BB481